MFKKTAAFCTALLLLIGATGCGKKTDTNRRSEEKPLQTEPIIQLDCFSENGLSADIVEVDNHRVGIISESMPEGSGQDGETQTTFYLVNLAENRIETQKDNVKFGDLLGIGNNGEVIGWDYANSALMIYDSSLSLKHTVPIKSAGRTLFIREEQSILSLEGEDLIRVGLDGKKQTLLSLPGVINIEAYDPQKGVILLQDGNIGEDRLVQNEYTAYSVREKQVLYSVKANSALAFTGQAAWFGTSIIKPGENEISDVYLQLCDPDNGQIRKTYQLSTDGYVSDTGNAGFALWASYCFDMEDKPTYRMLDLSNGKATDWSVGKEGDDVRGGAFVNGGKNFACLVADRDGNQKLYLTAPDLLTYPETLEEVEKNVSEGSTPPSDAFERERKLADKIEQDFSVHILIGESCKTAQDVFAYDFTLTDGADDAGRTALYDALSLTESVLRLYPDGFFKNFKNYRDAGGIRFYYVNDIKNRNGTFAPNGLTQNTDGWYNIALRTDSITERTLHHELWHAVEYRIAKADSELLNMEEWNKLNPDGFEYHTDLDNYSEKRGILSLTLISPNRDAYFIDMYSAVTAEEDRATLIEQVLADTFDSEFYGEPDPLTLIGNCPHLKDKLTVLEKAVKQVFGAVYWEDVIANRAAAAKTK